MRLYLELSRQLVDSNLTHTKDTAYSPFQDAFHPATTARLRGMIPDSAAPIADRQKTTSTVQTLEPRQDYTLSWTPPANVNRFVPSKKAAGGCWSALHRLRGFMRRRYWSRRKVRGALYRGRGVSVIDRFGRRIRGCCDRLFSRRRTC